MAKLRRATPSAIAGDSALRLRAAWLYHGHGLTQNDVAEQLGIGRTTVIRLLDEARKRGEVRIWIEDGGAGLEGLALDLERKFGLDEAIVVPGSGDVEATAQSVGLALGKFLSETIADNMSIGVGWGRTLTASLRGFGPPGRTGVKVMSLLGGAVETRFANPVEFSWRLANALNAECFLFPAPLVVDSAATRQTLIAACGLDRLYRMAEGLDLAVLSAGDINAQSSSLARHLISKSEHRELVDMGCIADVMCNFIDGDGKLLPHPVNARVMSVGLETVRKAGHVVLASGGGARAPAIRAAIKALGCHTLVTDESAARALMELK